MKKVCMLLLICIALVLYKWYSPRFKLPNSLAEGEIAITFLDENVLLYRSNKNTFLLNLKDGGIDKYIKKYHLKDILVFTPSTVSCVNGIYIDDSGMIKITNGNQSFCIMGTDSCTFNYVYKNKGYLESEIYFYHNGTKSYVDNIINEKYNVSKDIVTLIFDEESYMVIDS